MIASLGHLSPAGQSPHSSSVDAKIVDKASGDWTAMTEAKSSMSCSGVLRNSALNVIHLDDLYLGEIQITKH